MLIFKRGTRSGAHPTEEEGYVIKFEWDSVKDASNLAKHGIAFTEATEVFGDHLAKIFPDPDHSIGEQRELIVGHNRSGKLLYVSFTERLESTIRIISARAATRKERNDYEQN